MVDVKKLSTKKLMALANKQSVSEGVQWMQTPAGRERMRRVMKQRRANGDASINTGNPGPRKLAASKEVTLPTQNGLPSHDDTEEQIAYIYGRIESQLEVYAANAGLTFPELAGRISELLRNKASGKVFRSPHRMSSVR